MAGPPRSEVRLDPSLQARLLEQMREEQEAAMRRRALRNWVLLPAAIASVIGGVWLSFSENLVVAFVANTIATGVVIVAWRTNREWIRNTLGF